MPKKSTKAVDAPEEVVEEIKEEIKEETTHPEPSAPAEEAPVMEVSVSVI